MTRVYFLLVVVLYLFFANVINGLLEAAYGFKSGEYILARVLESAIFVPLMYLRYKDASIRKSYTVASGVVVMVSSIVPILFYIPVAAGLIYKTSK